MSRLSDPGFDPRIADWLEADPDHAPPEVMRTVESALPSIPQRRAVRLPWRTMPMNRVLIVFATVGLIALLGAGAFAAGSRPTATAPTLAPVGVDAPASPAAPTASAGTTAVSYAAARDEICTRYTQLAQPLKDRYPPLFDSKATDAQRADATAALSSTADLVERMTAELQALDAPDALREAHITNAAQMGVQAILIRYELDLLAAGKTADAQAVDLATDPISRTIEAYENAHGLRPCP